MKKKLVAMVVAMTMCLGFAAQNVEAASCPPHNSTETFSEPVSHWTTTHRVYRNMYVDGKQVYSICTVTCDVVHYTMYCMTCKKKLHEEDVIYEKHSLTGDPDHK